MQRTRKDIVRAVSERLIIKYDLVDKVVAEFIRQLNAALVAGDSIEIRTWGRWSIKERGRYVGRNPSTGERLLVKPKLRVKFKAGKLLNESVNKK